MLSNWFFSAPFWQNKTIFTKFTVKPGIFCQTSQFRQIYGCTRFLHSCALCFVQVSPKTAHRCFLHIFDKTTQFREMFSCARCFQQVLAQTARLLVKLMLCTFLKKKANFKYFQSWACCLNMVFLKLRNLLAISCFLHVFDKTIKFHGKDHSCAGCFAHVSAKTANRCFLHVFEKQANLHALFRTRFSSNSAILYYKVIFSCSFLQSKPISNKSKVLYAVLLKFDIHKRRALINLWLNIIYLFILFIYLFNIYSIFTAILGVWKHT